MTLWAMTHNSRYLLGLTALFSGIMLVGAFLRLYGIGSQPPLADEVGVALSSVHYVENGQFGTMWFHPNLRNIIIYWVNGLLGAGPYALRLISLLTGILSIPLIGLLLYTLTRDKTASVLASFLLAMEQVHITFSRQAIQETWTTFFFLAGVLSAVLYYKKDRAYMLLLSGVLFGLGMASKFHAFFPLMAVLAAGLYLSCERRSFSRGVFVFSCLVLLPSIVYLLTYIPWFGRGYGIADWAEMQGVIFNKMMTHKGNPMDQVIDTEAWQWFLMPMGYANFVHSEGKPFVTVAFSNPFVWLLILPETAFIAWKYRLAISRSLRLQHSEEQDRGIVFLLSLFIVSYLPLALSPRPIWLLSSLAVMPFAFMIAGLAVSQWTRALRHGKKVVIGYTALVLLSSLLLYPMAIGKGKSYGYLNVIVERFRPPLERMQ